MRADMRRMLGVEEWKRAGEDVCNSAVAFWAATAAGAYAGRPLPLLAHVSN